jgi:hypothetical protein
VKEKEVNKLHRQLGKRTAGLEWASKKLIKSKLDNMSVIKQCELWGLNRSSFYYASKVDHEPKLKLLESGFAIDVNRLRSYMQELGLKTTYLTKAIRTTFANPEHQKYPYLLRELEINRANQV